MKIGVTGYNGRVAELVVQDLLSGNWTDLELAGACTRTPPEEKADFLITDDADALFAVSDVVIDFTLPDGTRNHIDLAAKHKTGLIIGTTGLSEEHEQAMREAAKETAIVYAANMSIGVNLLLALVEQTAARLDPSWDIEIAETHHRYKVDAPSGTAIAIGRAAAAGRAVNLDNVAVKSREGQTGARESGTIGFATSRGGDVVGEHTVTFYAEGERLELGHKATDRSLFAKGALKAAKWLKGKEPGLYSMRDVLDL